jgi:hypothetical protein
VPRYHFKCCECLKETIIYLHHPDEISRERISCAFCACPQLRLIEYCLDENLSDDSRIQELTGRVRELQDRLKMVTGEDEENDPTLLN